MQETTNYDLKKIELTDSPPDITVINPNWATVDTELKAAEDHVADGDIHFSALERTKLAGVEAGANAYTHPATHAASIIVQDASKRFVSDTEKATWNGKADGEHVHDAEDITSGTVTVAQGGIGRASLTFNSFLAGNNANPVQQLAPVAARELIGLGNTTGALSINVGGTGATSAAAALTALGLPYETGTWTITLYGAGGGAASFAAGDRWGKYVRIGDIVILTGGFDVYSRETMSGEVRISGLPFPGSGGGSGVVGAGSVPRLHKYPSVNYINPIDSAGSGIDSSLITSGWNLAVFTLVYTISA